MAKAKNPSALDLLGGLDWVWDAGMKVDYGLASGSRDLTVLSAETAAPRANRAVVMKLKDGWRVEYLRKEDGVDTKGEDDFEDVEAVKKAVLKRFGLTEAVAV